MKEESALDMRCTRDTHYFPGLFTYEAVRFGNCTCRRQRLVVDHSGAVASPTRRSRLARWLAARKRRKEAQAGMAAAADFVKAVGQRWYTDA